MILSFVIGIIFGIVTLSLFAIWHNKKRQVSPAVVTTTAELNSEFDSLLGQVQDSVEFYSGTLIQIGRIIADGKSDAEIVQELRNYYGQLKHIAEQYGIKVEGEKK